LIIIPALVAAQIGAAEPKTKERFHRHQDASVIELVHPAPSSSGDFDPFSLDRPTFRPLWTL
jgi:hypothetical protein